MAILFESLVQCLNFPDSSIAIHLLQRYFLILIERHCFLCLVLCMPYCFESSCSLTSECPHLVLLTHSVPSSCICLKLLLKFRSLTLKVFLRFVSSLLFCFLATMVTSGLVTGRSFYSKTSAISCRFLHTTSFVEFLRKTYLLLL